MLLPALVEEKEFVEGRPTSVPANRDGYWGGPARRAVEAGSEVLNRAIWCRGGGKRVPYGAEVVGIPT